MAITDLFEKNFRGRRAEGCTFSLVEYQNGYYVGVDAEGRAVVVVLSATPKAQPLIQESRSLSIKCNARVEYSLSGDVRVGTVHVLTCLSCDAGDKHLFLELADLLINEAERTADGILNVYRTLAEFFADASSLTDNELLGLYGELFTLCDFWPNYDFAHFWQSTDRMKYDFSFSEKLKVEVKSTLKPQRIHRFKHDQIVSDNCEIFIISYQLRPDDEGLSLLSLLEKSKILCSDEPKKILKLQSALKGAGRERLDSFRFNENFTRQQRKVYRAEELPHFKEKSPEGVSSAEYDIDFTGSSTISENEFLNRLSKEKSPA